MDQVEDSRSQRVTQDMSSGCALLLAKPGDSDRVSTVMTAMLYSFSLFFSLSSLSRFVATFCRLFERKRTTERERELLSMSVYMNITHERMIQGTATGSQTWLEKREREAIHEPPLKRIKTRED